MKVEQSAESAENQTDPHQFEISMQAAIENPNL